VDCDLNLILDIIKRIRKEGKGTGVNWDGEKLSGRKVYKEW
jgi:hypothetical protein